MNIAKGAAVIAGGLVLTVIGGVTCTHNINPGYAGIQYNRNGGLEDEVLGQGWNAVAPWIKVTEYPVSTEGAYYSNREDQGRESDDTLVLGTKDGKVLRGVEWTMNYHMADLPKVFNKFRGRPAQEIAYGYMRQTTSRILNEISSQYTMVELCGEKKQEFNNRSIDALRTFFEEDGINIEQGGLGELVPDEQTAAAIQAIANAQYKEKEAETQKRVAEAEAQTLIAKANGQAEAKRIEADAIAYYNQQVQNSSTPLTIEFEKIKKWNGENSKIVLGNNTGAMINVGQ